MIWFSVVLKPHWLYFSSVYVTTFPASHFTALSRGNHLFLWMLIKSCPRMVWKRPWSRGAFECTEMSDSGCPRGASFLKVWKLFLWLPEGRCPPCSQKAERLHQTLKHSESLMTSLNPSMHTCWRPLAIIHATGYVTLGMHKSSETLLKGLWEMVLPSTSQSFSPAPLLSPIGTFCAPQAKAALAGLLVWFRAPRWLTRDLNPSLPKSRTDLYLSCSQQMFA